MSTETHSVIIMPGGTANLYCVDGLSPLEVQHIKTFLNFGGAINAVDCGPQNEYMMLWQAELNMKYQVDHAAKKKIIHDMKIAYAIDHKQKSAFKYSDYFALWASSPEVQQQGGWLQAIF